MVAVYAACVGAAVLLAPRPVTLVVLAFAFACWLGGVTAKQPPAVAVCVGAAVLLAPETLTAWTVGFVLSCVLGGVTFTLLLQAYEDRSTPSP